MEKVVRHNNQLSKDQMTNKIREILKQLKQGMKIQESSACIMNFLIHDLLDFAQIKAGKFRKNY